MTFAVCARVTVWTNDVGLKIQGEQVYLLINIENFFATFPDFIGIFVYKFIRNMIPHISITALPKAPPLAGFLGLLTQDREKPVNKPR